MVEDTVTTEETDELSDEIEDSPSHPYDLPGEWFVLNAQSGHEKKVRTNILTRIKNLHLEDKVYDVVIPTDEVVEIRNGKKVNLEKKTFPGYVLVRMVEVKKGSPKFKPDFEIGETVRVTTGPFADFNGIIEEINLDQSKVTVLVNIFGRETPVELGFTDIVKN